MTAEHDSLRDLIAPVALEAAAPHEVARVEAHAAECAVCREELASLRAAADLLGMAVPQRDPSPRLKAAIMETVRAEAAERQGAAAAAGEPAAPPARERSGRRWFGVPAWPAAVVIASVVALLVGWGIASVTQGGDTPDTTALTISGTPDAPSITGKVLYLPKEDTAVVSLDRLPPLDPGDAYQLWIIRDGVPKSAGLFETTGPSTARTVATGLQGDDTLAVTAQPRSSRTTPQPPILITASL